MSSWLDSFSNIHVSIFIIASTADVALLIFDFTSFIDLGF
jgi:hypothetical protein